MKLLYRSFFDERYKRIAELIPENAHVVELCMGDAYLYEYYLKNKHVTYTGIDLNPVFIKAARKKEFPQFNKIFLLILFPREIM